MKRSTKGGASIWLFLFSPIVGLFTALFNYRSTYAKNLLWAFIAFYGLTMVVSNSGIDAERYRDKFFELERTQPGLGEFLGTLYTAESERFDILQPAVAYIVSKVTRNYHVQFAVFGLIFGFFYSRNIWGLLDHSRSKINMIGVLFLLTFSFINGFWNISGFRFWTAAHIYFYGAFLAFTGKRSTGTLFILAAGLAHFGFWVAVVPWMGYLLLGNRTTIYFMLFLVSLTISELSIDAFRQVVMQYSPGFLEEKLSRYTNESYVEVYYSRKVNTNWYVQGHQQVLKYVILVFMIALYFIREQLRKLPLTNSIYCFALLILSFGNVMSLLPSGGRYFVLASLFACSAIFLACQRLRTSYLIHSLGVLSAPALLLFCIVKIRVGFDTIGVMTVFGNPLVAMFTDIDMALIELIK